MFCTVACVYVCAYVCVQLCMCVVVFEWPFQLDVSLIQFSFCAPLAGALGIMIVVPEKLIDWLLAWLVGLLVD